MLRNYIFPGHLMQMKRMPFLQKNFFLLQNRSKPTNECLTTITSVKSCSAMVSVRSSYRQNTWKNVVQTAMNHPCILSSAIISNRMSRSIVQQVLMQSMTSQCGKSMDWTKRYASKLA